METVDFVNATEFFDGMELGHCESDEFLSKFVYGGNHTSLTLVSRGTFLSLLKSFITDCEDIYEKDVVMEALRDYNLSVDVRIKYVNIEA
jgi:hypothetical protein